MWAAGLGCSLGKTASKEMGWALCSGSQWQKLLFGCVYFAIQACWGSRSCSSVPPAPEHGQRPGSMRQWVCLCLGLGAGDGGQQLQWRPQGSRVGAAYQAVGPGVGMEPELRQRSWWWPGSATRTEASLTLMVPEPGRWSGSWPLLAPAHPQARFSTLHCSA